MSTPKRNKPIAKSDTRPLKSGYRQTDAIIMKIAKAFKDRSRKDIRKWRMALMAAENPERPRLNFYHDLVDDLLTDGTLQTQIALRKGATLAVNFQVRNRKTEQINVQATELLQQKWFYDYLETHLDAVILGTRLIEFFAFNGTAISFATIPPRNTVPVLKRIYPDLAMDRYIDYSRPELAKWLLELNDKKPLGLINNIIPNLIWKRNVAQSWAEFCEKFGMPLISANTNNSNTAHIANVERQLLALAEASVGVFPEGTTIKFDEANRTDAYQVYSKFIEQNSNEIAGTIVGSNTLGKDAANYAQTEVHERSLDDKLAKSDRRNIAFTVNDDLFPLLISQGYSYLSDDDVFEWLDNKEELTLTEYWPIVQGIMQDYEVEKEWLEKTFDIPLVKKKERPAHPFLNPYRKQQEEPEEPEDDEEAIAAYRKPNYPVSKNPTASGSNKILDGLTDELLQQLWDNEDTLGTKGTLIVEEALHLVQGLKKGFGVTAGWNTPDNLALQLMEYNLFEFSASKTEARLAAMTDLLIDKEKRKIRSFAEFKELAKKEVDKFSKTWLETEYNLSIAVGQNAAAYHRFMAEQDEVTNYVQYQTAGDGAVRDSHAALDGRVFSLKDKDAMDLWPPNGYGCRCEMIQYVGEPTTISKGQIGKQLMLQDNPKWSESQFGFNRGDLKLIFTDDQYYHDIKGLPKELNEMVFEKYNLKPWSSFKQELDTIKIDETITGENVKELFKKVGKEEFMRFTDYNGRKLIMQEAIFNEHLEEKYLNPREQRHRLFPHIKDTLKDPDEVWLFKYKNKKFQTRYVKFYRDKAVIVDTDTNMNSTTNEIKTWYPLVEKEEASRRKGFIIKRKENGNP